MNLKKSLLCFALCGAVSLSAAGCKMVSKNDTGSDADVGSQGTSSFGAAFPDVDLSNGIPVTDKEITIVTCLHGFEVCGTPTNWSEFTASFKKKYPNINISVETMSNGDARLMAMIAAGNGPDLIRLSGYQEIPSLAARSLLLPLDKYFEAANVDTSDFMPVMDLFRYDGKERGKGYYYGVVKDFSLDNAIWINKKAFNDAGIPLPSTTEPMTYDQLADYARRLTVREGDTTKRFGLNASVDWASIFESMLQSTGKSLWSEDTTETTLKSADTKKVIEFWAELVKEGVMPSTLNPISDNTGFGLLVEDKVAMIMGGYWLGTGLATYGEDFADNLLLVPSPKVEGGKTVNACLAATGIGIFSGSKHPNEAFLLLKELFLEEEQTKNRAEVGWGLPGLKSTVKYLPESTAPRKQFKETTLAQLEDMNFNCRVSNYCLYSGFTAAFDKQFNMYLYGKTTLDKALSKIDSDVQLLVQEGLDYTR